MSRSQRFFDSPQQVSQACKPQGQAAVKAAELNYCGRWSTTSRRQSVTTCCCWMFHRCVTSPGEPGDLVAVLLQPGHELKFTLLCSSFVVATCRSQRHVASAAAGLAYVVSVAAYG